MTSKIDFSSQIWFSPNNFSTQNSTFLDMTWGGVKWFRGSNQMVWVCKNKIGTIYTKFEEFWKNEFLKSKINYFFTYTKNINKIFWKTSEKGGKKLFGGVKNFWISKYIFSLFSCWKNHVCSSRIRGEIVFQKKARENGFRAQNPEKKRPSPLSPLRLAHKILKSATSSA